MYITTTAELNDFCASISHEPFVCVDTEFHRLHTYYPKLCLVQLATPTASALVDALSPSLSLEPLLTLLFDTPSVKVFHGARQDLEIFYHLRQGSLPSPLVDTQVMGMLLGFGDSVGYPTLVHHYLGHVLDKQLARSDWTIRPLTENQITYALDDVRFLVQVYPLMQQAIDDKGYADVLADAMMMTNGIAHFVVDPLLAYKRLPAFSGNAHFRAAVRILAAFRERVAMRENKVRRSCLSDSILFTLAQRLPQSEAALANIGHIPSFILDRYLPELLLELANAKSAEPLETPPYRRLPMALQDLHTLLSLLLKAVSYDLGIVSRLIANTDDLMAFAENPLDSDLLINQGWRYRLFGSIAQGIYQGDYAVTSALGQLRYLSVAKSL